MGKFKTNRTRMTILSLSVCLTASILGLILGNNFVSGDNKAALATAPRNVKKQESSQQPDEKVINLTKYETQPVVLNNLSVKNAKLEFYHKFNAKTLAEQKGGLVEDWIEDLEFTIKNESNKVITSITVQFEFSKQLIPEPRLTAPNIAYPHTIGPPPEATQDEVKYFEPLVLNPGEEFTLRLSTKQFNIIKKALAFNNYQLADMSRIDLRITRVVYNDGISWSNGRNFRKNPNWPGGFEPIDN
jgi:hypothetical protein